MQDAIQAKSALVSVFSKEGLTPIVKKMHELSITIYSTGGTAAFIEEQNIPVKQVEDLTSYPSILGGRVKTLHPKVFGGILNRRENENDQQELASYDIPHLDIVLVGCGEQMQFLSQEIRHAFAARGVGIDPMDTGAACRTFNILAIEERRVAAALVAVG